MTHNDSRDEEREMRRERENGDRRNRIGLMRVRCDDTSNPFRS